MGKIYLLETNLYTKEGDHVYKLGRSDQTGLKRLKDYEKDYEIVMIIACNDSVKVEAELIKLFIQKYKKHLKKEYFVGDKQQMMDDICETIRKVDATKREENRLLLKEVRETKTIVEEANKKWITNLKDDKAKWIKVLESHGVLDVKPVMMDRRHIRIPSPDSF
jgi:hypothetical protein